MRAYEFKTDIKNRIIVLPQNYPYSISKNVKVIVLVEEHEKNNVEESNTKEIINLFAQAAERNIFSTLTTTKEIIDWQKQQRNEWD